MSNYRVITEGRNFEQTGKTITILMRNVSVQFIKDDKDKILKIDFIDRITGDVVLSLDKQKVILIEKTED